MFPLSRVLLLGAVLSCGAPHAAQAQAPALPAVDFAGGSVRAAVTNTSRLESWRFFEPRPGGGDPAYAFFANRLRAGLTGTWSRVEVEAAVQAVQFVQLPTRAFGPGPLGTGGLYFDHSGRVDSGTAYLSRLAVRARLPGGVALQAGRLPYQSGSESPSGHAKIEAVKRARVDGRLLGEFEWSIYQRSYDGIRVDVDRQPWHLAAAWFQPTQGGFEIDAGARMPGVSVATASFALRPSVAVPATDLHVFTIRYDDDRPVTGRPDNTGRPAGRVDVGITTVGATAVGAAPAGSGEIDWLVWLAQQTGSWYELRHRAWSLAVEGGYQWQTRWQPWVRGGVLHATGDERPGDDRHGTFFAVLPTVRKYAFTASYAPMNLRDLFAEVTVRPTPRLVARADVRRLQLAQAADRWYAGSGAGEQRGASFGYAGRPSGGATDLGTVFEGAANLVINPYWSVNGFAGAIRGGQVVQQSFAGRWLRFAYLESVIQF